ncbi:hypothetical protein PZA11_006010 [Diplocarpon coronariae]
MSSSVRSILLRSSQASPSSNLFFMHVAFALRGKIASLGGGMFSTSRGLIPQVSDCFVRASDFLVQYATSSFQVLHDTSSYQRPGFAVAVLHAPLKVFIKLLPSDRLALASITWCPPRTIINKHDLGSPDLKNHKRDTGKSHLSYWYTQALLVSLLHGNINEFRRDVPRSEGLQKPLFALLTASELVV